MPIRYCTATSKRTKLPYRARAMRGRSVCYHHGGKSRGGVKHHFFKHGYYSVDPAAKMMWGMAQTDYEYAMRQQWMRDLYARLRAELPHETEPEFWRFMLVYRAQRAQLPDYPITRDMVPEMFEALKEVWYGQIVLSAMDDDG